MKDEETVKALEERVEGLRLETEMLEAKALKTRELLTHYESVLADMKHTTLLLTSFSNPFGPKKRRITVRDVVDQTLETRGDGLPWREILAWANQNIKGFKSASEASFRNGVYGLQDEGYTVDKGRVWRPGKQEKLI